MSDARLFSGWEPADPDNKFHRGSGQDGKHYWLTPPDLMAELQERYGFTFDACPYPKPEDFDGLTCDWGESTYVNPPFGSVWHEGKKKGMTAWVRKAIAEAAKGKRVVMVYPIDKWVLMLLAAGAKVSNLGDVKWCATEDGSPGPGTGRHIACFVLGDPEAPDAAEVRRLRTELDRRTLERDLLATLGLALTRYLTIGGSLIAREFRAALLFAEETA